MENLKGLLEKQLEELEALVNVSEKMVMASKKLPNTRVKVSKSKGCNQYYFVDAETKKMVYAKKNDRQKISELVQRDYVIEVNKILKKLKGRLERFIDSYDINEIFDVYERMPVAKQEVVTPIIKTEEQFVNQWLNENVGMCNVYHEEGDVLTERGELVRSKSEKIIADSLYKYGVPYQYEPVLKLGNNHVFPDFIVLNKRTRKTIYWEHLGMLTDKEYAINSWRKMQKYSRYGYFLGKDLIITMESIDSQLDVRTVEKNIKELLL